MPSDSDIPVLVIFGPTATGKTAIAETLFADPCPEFQYRDSFDRFRGKAEIVSADSMQVYRFLDIGTAKPDHELLNCLPHHLIDICNPDQQFCAGDFVRLADLACQDIHSRGKLPVLMGGTAFYIRNFLYGLPDTPVSDPFLRKNLQIRIRKEGSEALYRELVLADPERAAKIHPNDEYRIIRALEVFLSSGRPASSFDVPSVYRSGYRFLVIALERERNDLYGRIDARVEAMFDKGLAREFESLLRSGYSAKDPGMQAIGYREFFLADPPGSDIPLICDRIKQDSRKYAKRQETFIKGIPDIVSVHADNARAVYDALVSFMTGSP